jgi:hypothetical protein
LLNTLSPLEFAGTIPGISLLERIYRKAYRALRVHGIGGSLRLIVARARGLDRTATSDFDERFGVVTDGREDLSELRITDRTNYLLGNRYMPTHETIVHQMIRSVPHPKGSESSSTPAPARAACS